MGSLTAMHRKTKPLISDKILCVDDDARTLAAYARQLSGQFHVDTALGADEGLAAMSECGPYAVVVCDRRMPGMDGIQFLAQLREAEPDTVRIMLTGYPDLQTTIEAVNQGCIFRFLCKPCPPDILNEALVAGLEHHRLVATERDELLRIATTDALTGVANRFAFDQRLQLELDLAISTGRAVILLMVDVDHFKQFNDTLGHQGGDVVLQTVAHTLSDTIRSVDLLGRYGGDEFAVIAPECTLADASILAERLRNAIEENKVKYQGHFVTVTVSIGVAVAQWPDSPTTADGLLAKVDEQLYAAKRVGRNCCNFEVFECASSKT